VRDLIISGCRVRIIRSVPAYGWDSDGVSVIESGALGKEMDMEIPAVVLLAAVVLIGFGCQMLAWWLRLPAILFLLLVGMLVGPGSGLLEPDLLFGDLLFPIVSLSVAVILFEGGLTLHVSDLKEIGGGVIPRLMSVGAAAAWAITAIAAHWLLDTSWSIAVLFGAITVVTGPTVIIPMLRTVRPTARIASVLRWEGIIIDPLGAILAVLVFEYLAAEAAGIGHTALILLEIIGAGLLLGIGGGQLLGTALRRHWLPDYLHNFAALALVLSLFVLSNELADESGLLTVTIMGMWMANMKGLDLSDLLDFKESLSLLLISALFILLAARVQWSDFDALGLGALAVLLVMQFIARPVGVLLSTWGSNLDWRERALIAWVAPRGIVAAAVSALFALHLQQAGMAGAELLAPMTFLVIIFTVVLQSATARPLARLLGVAEADGHGFLIVGANDFSIALAGQLMKHDVRVLLADHEWTPTSRARMQGIPVYYGNVNSGHADLHLDLTGLTGLLALSSRNADNAMAVLRFSPEFGKQFTLRLPPSTDSSDRSRHLNERLTQVAFSAEATASQLLSKLADGQVIRSTRLSDEFDYAQWRQRADDVLPLLSINEKSEVHVFSDGDGYIPGSGHVVVYLGTVVLAGAADKPSPVAVA